MLVLGRIPMLRKFLRFLMWSLLALIALVILFYCEEDWRGAHAWTKAQAEMVTQGISLDPKSYIPPPVPEAENFGALSIFRLEPDHNQNKVLKPLAVDRAFAPLSEHFSYSKKQASEAGMLPWLGTWERGKTFDIGEVQKRLAELCREASPPIQVPANASASEMLGLLCPALSDLRTANATHPVCRFEYDYTDPIAPTSVMMSMKLTNGLLKVARVLAYEERLALYDNQPQLVLDDLSVDWKIDSGLQQEPFLISGLICGGIVTMQLGIIREGLDHHVWNDQQLIGLDADLGKIDFLTETQLCLPGDFVLSAIPNVARFKADRFSIVRYAREITLESSGRKLDWRTYLLFVPYWLGSNGDYDRDMADYARFVISEGAHMIDSASRRVFPEKEASQSGATLQIQSSLKCINKFAYSQVQVDEARVACRLERYRLAHGIYPATPDALVPTYGPNLPHDIMNGEPYHYKVNGDGTFLIYSVGWNQTDDGGKVVYKKDSPKQVDYQQGDWVWAAPNPGKS
jgi:hypothetical protein